MSLNGLDKVSELEIMQYTDPDDSNQAKPQELVLVAYQMVSKGMERGKLKLYKVSNQGPKWDLT